jgi:hypothetical protein
MSHDIKPRMEIIGADGGPIGTVDSVDAHHITLVPATAGAHKGHVHRISCGLVAAIEGNVVRLSANADVALTFEEEG